MKRYLQLSFVCILLLIFSIPGRADHGGGAELTYEWLHDSTYRFYFRFYRDCSGVIAPPNFELCFTNSCGLAPRTVYMSKAPHADNGRPIDEGCPGYPTRCETNNSILPGYQNWLYTATVTLPTQCDEWTFYVSVWARNPATNINSNVNDQDLYVEAKLNTRLAAGNSSPYFSNPPVPYVCMGVPVSYNNGVIDPDGDSIAIKLIQPMGDNSFGNRRCSFTTFGIPFRSAAYNLNDNPLDCGNTFVLDQQTGSIQYTPTIQQQAVLAFLVEEYRNGQLIGSVMRDLQTIVMPCNIQQPEFQLDTMAIQGGMWNGDRIEICRGNKLRLCFQINNPSATSQLIATDNSNLILPGSIATYNGIGSNQVTGCIEWQANTNDSGWRVINIRVKDQVCTAPGISVTQTYSIPIFILPSPLALKDTVICPGASVQLNAFGGNQFSWQVVPGGADIGSLSCNNCPSPIASPDKHTAYILTSDLNIPGCANKDTVYVWIDTSNQITISPESPLILCTADSVQLSVRASGSNKSQNLKCGPSISNCSKSLDTAFIERIRFNKVLNPEYSPFDGRYQTQRMQIVYTKTQLREALMESGSIGKIMLNFGNLTGTATFEQVKISMGCSQKMGFSTVTNWETGLTEVFSAPSVSIVSGWNTFELDQHYDWDTTQGIIIEFCYSNSNPTIPTPVYYIPQNGGNTILKNFQTNAGNACLQPAANSDRRIGTPEIRFLYCRAEEPFSYRWTSANNTWDADSINLYITEPTKIHVSTSGRSGCLIKDSIEIVFDTDKFTISPEEDSICFGDQIQIKVEGGDIFSWYEHDFQPATQLSCTNCSDPIASPPYTTNFTVIVSNELGCKDTLSSFIHVLPVPDIEVLNQDTMVIYGVPIKLEARGAVRYLWTPAASFDDPNSATPIVTPTAPGYYIAKGFGDNGCSSSDSIYIDIDYRGKTFIPSAFSPNGDGLNDVFRVYNLSFQQIEVFKVFNRWGQEVFSTLDPLQGWDGTFNGVPTETGAYYYMIKLKYPDGTNQFFKGNVTLIR